MDAGDTVGRGVEPSRANPWADAQLRLLPAEERRQKARRARSYNKRQVPALRAGGMLALVGLVVAHNAWVSETPQWHQVGVFALCAILYVLGSWQLLRRFYRVTERGPDLGEVFFGLDIALFLGAVYVTGGPQSWLFFVLLARAVDQTNTSASKVRVYGALTLVGQLALAWWTLEIEGRPGSWPVELFKAFGVFALGTYASSAAATAERQRGRTSKVVHVARSLVQALEDRTRELEVERQRAEEAASAKEEFLARMSHEIRTPLNGVLGTASLLEGTRLDAEQRDLVNTMTSSGDLLLAVINDVLDFSKIRAGKLSLEVETVCAGEAVDSVLDMLGGVAIARGVTLRGEVDPAALAPFGTDGVRLRQVLWNLVGNALKFTEHGEVSVRVTQTEGRYRFEVRDTGAGIGEEAQARLFDPFEQADGSSTRRYGGTGLGLAICKAIIEQQGGSIGVHSRMGQGSCFWFELPWQAPPTAVPKARDSSPELRLAPDLDVEQRKRSFTPVQSTDANEARAGNKPSLEILVAEDNAVNQRVIHRLLERMGHRVTVVENGHEAVATAEHVNFDLILMDCMMPEMDGYQATRALRAAGFERPILALTANATREDVARSFEAGMDAHLTKPVRRQELEQAVAVWSPASAAA